MLAHEFVVFFAVRNAINKSAFLGPRGTRFFDLLGSIRALELVDFC